MISKIKEKGFIKQTLTDNGITLIALVVTIVVLLILASVSITVVFGENGILQLAKEAGEKTNEAVQNDKENIGNITNYIKSLSWDESKVTAVTTKDGGIVPVPKGFVASEVEGENTVKDGFVIYQIPEGQSLDWKEDNDNDGILDVQKEYNQFVWVPVFDETPIFTTNNGQNVGQLYDFGDSSNPKVPATKIDQFPTRGYREPDTVEDDVSNSNSVKENGYNAFKTQLQKEFNDLVDSVNKYGGFYIGRYETSGLKDNETPIVQAGKNPTVETDWYTMYKNSKKIASENNSVTSSMIWGSQWDAVMNWFLSSSVETTRNYVTNSSGKGVYSQDAKTTTGSNSNYALNNIYDMAGNVWEWTIETFGINTRVARGGRCLSLGSNAPSSSRNGSNPAADENAYLGSRAALYVNL